MKVPRRAGLGVSPLPTISSKPSIQTTKNIWDALITPKPELIRRNGNPLDINDPRFIGWQTTGKEVVQRACNLGYTYSESGDYWNCCPTTGDCSFANNCITYGTSQLEVYPNGDTSLCSSSLYCYFDYAYTARDDPSPKAFVGCATNYFHALRTAKSHEAEQWTFDTPPRPSTISFAPQLHPTATSDKLANADHSSQLGGEFSISWKIKLTPVTGGILGGIILLVILLCWLGGKRQRRNAARKRNPIAIRPHVSPFVPPPDPNPPPYAIVFPQQHELTPIPIHNTHDPRPPVLGGGILRVGQNPYARLPGEEVQDGFSPNVGQTTGVIDGAGITAVSDRQIGDHEQQQ